MDYLHNGLELFSFKFNNLISDEPVIAHVGYLESMARTALRDTSILNCLYLSIQTLVFLIGGDSLII